MTRPAASSLAGLEAQLLRTLDALGGEGTAGELVALVARSRVEVERALEALISSGRVHVKVSGSGDVSYRREHPASPVPTRSTALRAGSPFPGSDRPQAAVRFDRKTLHLIRTLGGVLSLAELVEHTGTSVAEARREMRRLTAWYGGEEHPSLDGHVVFAFPLVMTTVHAPAGTRAPRPAWARLGDPMGSRRLTEGRSWVGRLAYSLGALSLARRVVRRVEPLRALRLRQRSVLRRLVLGHVIHTALAGRGVVSVETARRYLQSRSGGLRVGRARVEAVLRELAREFDASITREGDELFFGFRNVKRQFLAAELVRRRLALGRLVTGPTVFDSGDSPRAAAQRDLEAFDRELASG